jgi:3,4-dihydroxy 2-butanone 4-phosphate synthase
MSDAILAAIKAFSQGLPVCLFDSEKREGETDLLFSAQFAQPSTMRQLRQDCGGLLFLAIGDEVGELYSLPFLQDLYTFPELTNKFQVLTHLITDDLKYDSRSAFTLSLNHRDTYTGITDLDRALTTRRFAELTNELFESKATMDEAKIALGKEFRTPGHIPVCRETKGGFSRRQGHTELAVGLARLSKTTPVVIGAEMLQQDGDNALSVEDARAWAMERSIPFLEGIDIIEALLNSGEDSPTI